MSEEENPYMTDIDWWREQGINFPKIFLWNRALQAASTEKNHFKHCIIKQNGSIEPILVQLDYGRALIQNPRRYW